MEKKVYISNAFSLQMVNEGNYDLHVEEVNKEEVPFETAYSVVGHADTANVLGVKFNRESVTLQEGDILYVAQIIGGRLPEGCTTLPEGFRMKFLKMTLSHNWYL